MAEILLPHTGRGKELRELLCEELGIPAGVQWFEVRFALREPVSVQCAFLPRVAEAETEEEEGDEERVDVSSLDDDGPVYLPVTNAADLDG